VAAVLQWGGGYWVRLLPLVLLLLLLLLLLLWWLPLQLVGTRRGVVVHLPLLWKPEDSLPLLLLLHPLLLYPPMVLQVSASLDLVSACWVPVQGRAGQ
jgi:hypothetical protein